MAAPVSIEGHQLAPEQTAPSECEWKQGDSARGKW
jgi:hypothetical protein